MCGCSKRAGENAGSGRSGGEEWRRRGEEVWSAWGWIGRGRERVARESDVFFGAPGANRVGGGRVMPGRALGGLGTLAKRYGERKVMAVG